MKENIYGRKTVKTIPYFPKCIYSGNVRDIPYEIASSNITEEFKNRYNYKFMNEECDCPSCASKRKDRDRMIRRLYEIKDYKSLKAMGVEV